MVGPMAGAVPPCWLPLQDAAPAAPSGSMGSLDEILNDVRVTSMEYEEIADKTLKVHAARCSIAAAPCTCFHGHVWLRERCGDVCLQPGHAPKGVGTDVHCLTAYTRCSAWADCLFQQSHWTRSGQQSGPTIPLTVHPAIVLEGRRAHVGSTSKAHSLPLVSCSQDIHELEALIARETQRAPLFLPESIEDDPSDSSSDSGTDWDESVDSTGALWPQARGQADELQVVRADAAMEDW
jgi:hypothetical protein